MLWFNSYLANKCCSQFESIKHLTELKCQFTNGILTIKLIQYRINGTHIPRFNINLKLKLSFYIDFMGKFKDKINGEYWPWSCFAELQQNRFSNRRFLDISYVQENVKSFVFNAIIHLSYLR